MSKNVITIIFVLILLGVQVFFFFHERNKEKTADVPQEAVASQSAE